MPGVQRLLQLQRAGWQPAHGTLPRPPAQRIALAQDAAFSFTYPHVLEGWRRAGAEILPFSPLADEAPDADAGLVWLPGGYPEDLQPLAACAHDVLVMHNAMDFPVEHTRAHAMAPHKQRFLCRDHGW